MEAFAIVSFANNVLDFVNIARNILADARELYISTTGSKQDQVELKDLVQHVRRSAERTRPLPSLTSVANEDIRSLSDQCLKIADELSNLLTSVRVDGVGAKRVWYSVHQAVRTLWNKDIIARLQQRLDQVNAQLFMNIMVEKQDVTLRELEDMRGSLLVVASDWRPQFNNISEKLEQVLQHTTAKDSARGIPNVLEVANAFGDIADLDSDMRLLRALRFPSIDDRFLRISDAHSETYKWVLEKTVVEEGADEGLANSFVDWLNSSAGIFWVSGKPGSGKSTLMKFLCTESEARNLVQSWAGGHNLVTAKYFFWNAAKEPLQKSQVGLLRSLLYDILRQNPQHMRRLFPDVWNMYRCGQKDGAAILTTLISDASSLLTLLQNIVCSLDEEQSRWFFFIDGLDEYDGKASDIVRLISILKGIPKLKLCLSSRPLNEFQDAFGRENPWTLALHSHTKQDMIHYVESNIGKHQDYQDRRRFEDGYPDLVREIVDSAQGVFLWVKLVVHELLEGLTNGETTRELLERLRLVPPELDDFFQYILDSVPQSYRRESARLFSITLDAQRLLPLMTYWYVTERASLPHTQSSSEGNIARPDMYASFEWIGKGKAQFRLSQTRKRLNAKCKHLLDVYPNYEHREDWQFYGEPVDFCHRTVRDFLQSGNVRRQLALWSQNVDSDKDISDGAFAHMQLKDILHDPAVPNRGLAQLLALCLWHASRHQRSRGGEHDDAFLEGFKEICKIHDFSRQFLFWGLRTISTHDDCEYLDAHAFFKEVADQAGLPEVSGVPPLTIAMRTSGLSHSEVPTQTHTARSKKKRGSWIKSVFRR